MVDKNNNQSEEELQKKYNHLLEMYKHDLLIESRYLILRHQAINNGEDLENIDVENIAIELDKEDIEERLEERMNKRGDQV